MRCRVVTFGEIMLRLSPEGYDRLFQNDRMLATFGGAEANVAVSLANFGEDACFVTAVPENPVGCAAVAELRSFGIDTSRIVYGGDRLGIYYMEKGMGVRPSRCIYDRAHSAISECDPAAFDWQEILKGASGFHFTGITAALSKSCAQACLDACRTARDMGIRVSCDLNYRSKLWSKAEARETMTELCGYVDVLIANEQDCADVFGIAAADSDVDGGQLSRDGYESVARQVAQMFGVKAVAITLRTSISASENNWAAMMYSKDADMSVFSREYHLDIADRVGGGDSFAAGLIYAMGRNGTGDPGTLQETIEFAVAASALKHTVEGDFNRVGIGEVMAVMNGDISGRIKR